MRKAELQKRIDAAIKKVRAEMSGGGSGLYARGLSAEGYAGGYVQCLYDIQLLLNDVEPNDSGRSNGYWKQP